MVGYNRIIESWFDKNYTRKDKTMATEKEENLLCLVEVMKIEMFLIGQDCFNARWILRNELYKTAREQKWNSMTLWKRISSVTMIGY